jgi:hypothetical protein
LPKDFAKEKKNTTRQLFTSPPNTPPYAQAYFPAKLIRVKKLDPKRTYVFGWHPHGRGKEWKGMGSYKYMHGFESAAKRVTVRCVFLD